MATPEATRNLGIGLIVGGGVAAALAAVLFWVASGEDWNIGPLVFAGITALLAVFLIGYGIQKIVAGGS